MASYVLRFSHGVPSHRIARRRPGAMLKVTVRNDHGLLETWELEGKLSGEWVKELNRCWLERPNQPGVALQINLKAVTFIDASGKQLLKEMHSRGVEIKGRGCMIQAVVDEITREIGESADGQG